jgi:hypothetical protein
VGNRTHVPHVTLGSLDRPANLQEVNIRRGLLRVFAVGQQVSQSGILEYL